MDLSGKAVIVTGASRGLGRVMADALVAAGADVVTTSRGPAAGDGTGPSGRHIVADVSADADCARVAEAALDTFGRIDALFNNAALGMNTLNRGGSRPEKFWDLTPADVERFLEINFLGLFRMTRAVVPHMIAAGRGQIVNLSTSLATMQRPGYSPYGPSKAAVEAATVAWAAELDGTGVGMNVLIPGGPSRTDMLTGDPGVNIPDEKLLDPAIMGPPACWLASDAARGITGKRIVAARWRPDLPADEAAAVAAEPAGW